MRLINGLAAGIFFASTCISRPGGILMNTLKDKIKELEREEIVNALRESNWVMARAARRLGITERMIGYKIKKLGIRKIFEREGEGKEL